MRAFSANGNGKKIWRLSKHSGEPELKPIQKVAVRFHLYTPMDGNKRDYSFEERLADVEQLFGSPIWRGLCTDFVDIKWQPLRKGVALLAAIMFLRTPLRYEEFRTTHRRMCDWFSALPEILEEVELQGKVVRLDQSSWESYRDADEDAIKRMWIEHLGQAGWLAEILLSMRWSVIASDHPVFITSDNPVMPVHEDLRFRGFNNANTSVIFPLSPTRVLHLDHRMHEPDGQYYPLRDNGGSLNTLVWRNAIEYMLSSIHPDEICAGMVEQAEAMGFA